MKNEFVIDRKCISALQEVLINAQSQVNGLLDVSRIMEEPELIIPDVYLSDAETCRILSISNPTLKSIVKEKLLLIPSDRTNMRDRYHLKEILWLLTKPFRGARRETIEKLRKEKQLLLHK